MATTDYATLSEVKAWLGVTGTSQDAILPAVISAASRSIDDFCGRRFWLDDAAFTLRFVPEFADLLYLPDVGSTTNFAVASDFDDDGVFETAWTADARSGYGFRLEPMNALAPTETKERKPYTRLRVLSGSFSNADVAVTAIWGFPSVPEPVKSATLMLSSRIWKRKDAILGVSGGPDIGFVELARRIDPDIARSLNPYRRETAGAI